MRGEFPSSLLVMPINTLPSITFRPVRHPGLTAVQSKIAYGAHLRFANTVYETLAPSLAEAHRPMQPSLHLFVIGKLAQGTVAAVTCSSSLPPRERRRGWRGGWCLCMVTWIPRPAGQPRPPCVFKHHPSGRDSSPPKQCFAYSVFSTSNGETKQTSGPMGPRLGGIIERLLISLLARPSIFVARLGWVGASRGRKLRI